MVHAMSGTGAWSGPTFLLTRGGTNSATEGLMAPTLFWQLDLMTMLDVAAAFDTEQEARDACNAISDLVSRVVPDLRQQQQEQADPAAEIGFWNT